MSPAGHHHCKWTRNWRALAQTLTSSRPHHWYSHNFIYINIHNIPTACPLTQRKNENTQRWKHERYSPYLIIFSARACSDVLSPRAALEELAVVIHFVQWALERLSAFPCDVHFGKCSTMVSEMGLLLTKTIKNVANWNNPKIN